jgi:hypothetical protein
MPNPIWHSQLSAGDSLEIEVVGGGLSVYNYDGSTDATYLMILGHTESIELRDFLSRYIEGE